MRNFSPSLVLLLAVLSVPASAAEDNVELAPFAQSRGPSSGPSYLDRASELAIRALSLIGVNYRYGGNSPETGLDCSGLVSLVFREVAGKILPRDSFGMAKLGERVEKTGLVPGDLVFFNTRRKPYSHVGIYIGENRFVHAPSRGGRVHIANMQDMYWRNRFDGARRIDM